MGISFSSTKPNAPRRLHALAHGFAQMGKRAATNEKNVAGVQLDELLLGMLAPLSRRHIAGGALDDLEQRLLHPFAAYVAGNAGVVAPLAGNLVDLVDIDNAVGGAGGVPVGVLQQPHQDALHILAHITRLGQRGGVGNGKGHIQQARQGLRQQRLAAARGTNQQHIALGQLDFGILGNLVFAQRRVEAVRPKTRL
jgi:hypothetical protein